MFHPLRGNLAGENRNVDGGKTLFFDSADPIFHGRSPVWEEFILVKNPGGKGLFCRKGRELFLSRQAPAWLAKTTQKKPGSLAGLQMWLKCGQKFMFLRDDKNHNLLILMVGREGIEPSTY
jgi:hypothetical protein